MSWLESKHCDNRTPVNFGHQTSAALNSSLRGLHKIEKNSKHTKFTSQLKSGPTVQPHISVKPKNELLHNASNMHLSVPRARPVLANLNQIWHVASL